jgi:hypothetical protein
MSAELMRKYADIIAEQEQLSEAEQLNEMIGPVIGLISRAAPQLINAWRVAAPAAAKGVQAVGRGAAAATKAAGPAVKAGAEVAAKNAPAIAVGYEVISTMEDIKNSVGKAADEVFNDPTSVVNAIRKYAGDIAGGLAQGSLLSLAQAAVKFALPLGVVLAILYGGKKLIDKVLG